MNDPMQTMSASLLTLRLLWGSFLVSICIFGVVLAVVEPSGPAENEIILALSGVALMQVPLVFVVRFVLMGRSMGLFVSSDLREQSAADDVSAALVEANKKYQTGSLVGFAIAESIALLGFVCSFLSGQLLYYVAFAAVGMLLIVVQFPRLDGLLALLEGPERKRVRQLLESRA